MNRSIAKNAIWRCDVCGEHSRIPVDIDNDSCPLVLICPVCNHRHEWTKVPVYPKILPIPNLKEFTLETQPDKDTQVPQPKNEDEKQEASHEPEILNEPPPFWELADKLGKLTRDMAYYLGELHSHIDAFQSEIQGYFESQWKRAGFFKKFWKPEFLPEFLDFPFITIPVGCEDETADAYARIVIAPKFFDPCMGFNIYGAGGFRVEVMNQYSRMNFPLETSVCTNLGVPADLDLQVRGNKIIGSSLPLCWEDIPGLVEDADSNEEWTSVYIARSYLTRKWLAQHGIIPWESKIINALELTYRTLEDNIKESPLFLDAWKKFLKHGRLAVFWDNTHMSRQFAMLVGLMVRGIAVVFIDGNETRNHWNNLYENINCPLRTNNELVYFENGEPVNWDAVYQTKTVIIDMHGELDSNAIDHLFDYTGKILIISNDPLMDFNEGNILASKVHALAGFETFYPAVTDKTWAAKKWPAAQVNILERLKLLQRTR